uniref:Uncharacterized protein n=1 Tax=Rhizophora mucronata TaxID=61149 RepID=A0A2P2QSD6_RHIMU
MNNSSHLHKSHAPYLKLEFKILKIGI